MTEVAISPGKLVIEVQGWDRLWSFRSRLEIPLEHVAGVHADPTIARGWWKGLRVAGTNIPGVLAAGTFYQHAETYKKLIIEVTDPAGTVARIQGALSKRR